MTAGSMGSWRAMVVVEINNSSDVTHEFHWLLCICKQNETCRATFEQVGTSEWPRNHFNNSKTITAPTKILTAQTLCHTAMDIQCWFLMPLCHTVFQIIWHPQLAMLGVHSHLLLEEIAILHYITHWNLQSFHVYPQNRKRAQWFAVLKLITRIKPRWFTKDCNWDFALQKRNKPCDKKEKTTKSNTDGSSFNVP